jgi:hypothetical protein
VRYLVDEGSRPGTRYFTQKNIYGNNNNNNNNDGAKLY